VEDFCTRQDRDPAAVSHDSAMPGFPQSLTATPPQSTTTMTPHQSSTTTTPPQSTMTTPAPSSVPPSLSAASSQTGVPDIDDDDEDNIVQPKPRKSSTTIFDDLSN